MLNGLQDRSLGKAGVRLSSKLEISGLPENAYLLKVLATSCSKRTNQHWIQVTFIYRCFAHLCSKKAIGDRIGNLVL